MFFRYILAVWFVFICSNALAASSNHDNQTNDTNSDISPLIVVEDDSSAGLEITTVSDIDDDSGFPWDKPSDNDDSSSKFIDLRFNGKLQSDIRFRGKEINVGDFYQSFALPQGVERNENIFKAQLEALSGRFVLVADIDFVWKGFSQNLSNLSNLSQRANVDPYYLEVHGLYVEAQNIFVEGLDLRVGQQLVQWGMADQFNPTNTINPNDLEDPLLFGTQMANLMARLDYSITANWTASAVVIPVFKPALLPNTAYLGVAAVDRLPFINTDFRRRIIAEMQSAAYLGFPTIVTEATPTLPESSLDNMQAAFRLAGSLLDQDIAFSYYYGRSDMPQAYLNHTYFNEQEQCNPINPSECIRGILETQVSLRYPRLQVVGLNMTGELGFINKIFSSAAPLGYRFELGVYFPEKQTITLMQEFINMGITTRPEGEYDYGLDGENPVVVDDTPFAKWTFGLDYTLGSHVMINVMWVHGMMDDFGAGDYFHEGYNLRQSYAENDVINCGLFGDGTECAVEVLRPKIPDYLVAGIDLKFFKQNLLLRLFTIVDLGGIVIERWDANQQKRVRTNYHPFTSEAFSAVFFPEINFNFGSGFDLGAGALIQLGKEYTKFGDAAAGGQIIFTRARYMF